MDASNPPSSGVFAGIFAGISTGIFAYVFIGISISTKPTTVGQCVLSLMKPVRAKQCYRGKFPLYSKNGKLVLP